MANNNTATTTRSGGLSVATILGVVFLVCKLGKFGAIAHWSWLWVLSPFWIPFAFALTVWVLFLIAAAVAAAVK